MKVIPIKGKGYVKYLFTELGLPGNEEFSLFLWEDGSESPAHDHSVDETTYVVMGCLTEIRKAGEEFIKTIHAEGTQFHVPAGTQHVIKANGPAISANFCNGRLEMKILEDFLGKFLLIE